MIKETKIKIAGVEYDLKKTYKGLYLFEEIAEKSVSKMNDSVTDRITLFFCFLKASNALFNYSFQDFLDVVDDELMNAFDLYLISLASKEVEEPKKKLAKKA